MGPEPATPAPAECMGPNDPPAHHSRPSPGPAIRGWRNPYGAMARPYPCATATATAIRVSSRAWRAAAGWRSMRAPAMAPSIRVRT
jgi:hypothetical protein